MLSSVVRLCLSLLLFMVPLSATACSDPGQYKKVQLKTEGQTAQNDPSKPTKAPLRVGVAAVISPKETMRSYSEILDYLSVKLERPIELTQRQTYAEMNDLIRSGNVDVAFVCTQAYVEGQIEFGLEALLAPQVRGDTIYYSYLIVPRDSEIDTFEHLRGKTFAFSDPMSNSGRLAPVYLLFTLGQSPATYFKRSVFTYSHDNSIKAVAEKLVDGAAVDSLVYEFSEARNPEFTSRTKIIGKMGPYGTPPVVVHPELDHSLKDALREVLLNMHEELAGRKILDQLLIDRFVLPQEKQYDPVRQMLAKVRQQ